MSESLETRTPSRLLAVWRQYSSPLVPVFAVFTALVVGALMIGLTGGDWLTAYIGLWEGSFGSWRGIGNTVVRSTPYIICGLAVALGFKGGLFNIGAEGQLYAGAVLTVIVATSLKLPAIIHVPLALAAGAVGGALWGGIAGFLKARTGAHEVITTIMLNYVALRLTEWLIKSKTPYLLGDPEDTTGARTRFIEDSARLPGFQIGDTTRLHMGILIGIALAFAVWWLLYKTTIGFELRTAGANPSAARYAGISVPSTIVLTMALSGGLAGIAGAGEVLGVRGALSADLLAGLGFDAIAVALLARSNPLGIIASGILWGGLLTGASLMQVRAGLSIDVIKIVQALIIMFVAADQIVRFIYRIPKRGPGEETSIAKSWGG
ncbi:ABC transporter permease [Oscillochloris sp. ZM17-4]|uniref:ABC transporter permease n=1 Tax=Oscillochloris sp. ZM17-4 TaxID=2866714 RepID=UPI001C72F0AD|nr:ABC transporter permease [Oscillochloris sp. ZM17-4]MBX0327367.1 ABC transporter permease [Oscillochloris sp. ZM17-4]